MKTLSALLSIGALSFASSTMAIEPNSQLPSGESTISIEKKLTMSCFKNRLGDRMYVGEAETVTFCRKAARRAIANAMEAGALDLAANSQKTSAKLN